MRAARSTCWLVPLFLLVLPGCLGELGGPADGPPPELEPGAIPLEEEELEDEAFEAGSEAGYAVSPPLTVAELVDRWGCSTAPTMPLSAQIAQQMNCIEDGFFESLSGVPNLALGPAAAPFLQGPAARALRRAAARAPGSTFEVTSSWRSVVQQYVLWSWQGSCGIGVAARPGGSNHESGLAIDVPLSTTTAFRSALREGGFRWYCDATNGGRSSGCRDLPHHDFGGGGADLRSRSVLAFQQLWNRAHPEDRIGEDGRFGNATASRIGRSPLAGFPTGTTCGPARAPSCGDGACAEGESCASCPADCGECAEACGDGSCAGGESCASCPADCGACPAGACAVEGHGGEGDNGEPCGAEPESWRCVHSPRWGESISQVCRGGLWVTYEIAPRDCDGCCGEYSLACQP